MTRVGIVGPACPTGVGNATREFFDHLPFSKWLVIKKDGLEHREDWLDHRCTIWRWSDGASLVDEWLHDIDVMFSIQDLQIPLASLMTRHKRVRVALMPMEEWVNPSAVSLLRVDTFLAPTAACAAYLSDIGFGGRVEYTPFPVDTDRFGFKRRDRASTFLHCRGRGGYKGRKGSDIVVALAARCSHINFVVHYQTEWTGPSTPNVAFVGATPEPESQYVSGDVAIQPSRWEGVGLQILEAMATGLPTLVPNGPPMNEYPIDERLLVTARGQPVTLGGKTWTAWEVELDALARAVEGLHGTSIGELSVRSRLRMEERSWRRLAPRYAELLGMNSRNLVEVTD